MGQSISESEVIEFLKAIADGSIRLSPEAEPQRIYAGDVSYVASNGWRITVFNDCNTWDYIDRVQASDGRAADFDALEEMPSVAAYNPTPEIAWTRYGIPGYCIFRCTACGTLISNPQPSGPYLCNACRDRVRPDVV